MLSLFKGVFEARANAALKDELGDLMRRTNRTRDLDVYLLDRAAYYALIPASAHAGLDILFERIERERAAAWAATRAFLSSEDYQARMATLVDRFAASDVPKGPSADEAAGAFARRAILRKYRKVSKIGRSIDDATPDETIHALRIECKKLRYLMEFFSPLFEEKRVKPLIKSLKSLQDVLGRFNDHSVQRASLSALMEGCPARGARQLRLVESVGALVATLYQLQLRARGEVGGRVRGFVNTETERRFERLKPTGA